MFRRRSILLGTVGALATPTILRAQTAASQAPIRIGEINSYTAAAPFTLPYRNGWQLAVEQVNAAFAAAASSGPLAKVLVYTEDPIVSSDIVGSPASCTFDAGLTMVMPSASGITLVKVNGWSDNEWG